MSNLNSFEAVATPPADGHIAGVRSSISKVEFGGTATYGAVFSNGEKVEDASRWVIMGDFATCMEPTSGLVMTQFWLTDVARRDARGYCLEELIDSTWATYADIRRFLSFARTLEEKDARGQVATVGLDNLLADQPKG